MATSHIRKKLIEVSIPLELINEEARRRKQKAPKGYPTSFHKYWAQRPVAACRAMLFAQLVDDPSAWPDRFPGEEEQEIERKRLHRVIQRLVPWEASRNETILDEARWEIARSVAWGLGETPPRKGDSSGIVDYLQQKAPPVYDPFCGAGSIPLEAQRLGLRVYGSDLNSVAVLISKALVEIPPTFANLPPANPTAAGELKQAGAWNGKGAAGLALDVQFYAARVIDRAWRELSAFYPRITLSRGEMADTVAWMWARTVRSPDPSAKGAMVPLVSSFLLSLREGKVSWAKTEIDPDARDGWKFAVCSGSLSKEEIDLVKCGTKGNARSADFTCVLTGTTISGDYIKSEGMAGRLGARLMAIVADGPQGRIYVNPLDEHEEIAISASKHSKLLIARDDWLNQPVPARLTGGTCYPYGLTTFAKLYTYRQLLALTVFSEVAHGLRDEIESDAIAAGMTREAPGLGSGGAGARAYAEAIIVYLTIAIGRMALYGSSLCRWLTKDNALGSAIPQKGLEMNWDFAEANFFAQSSASLKLCTKNVTDCLQQQNFRRDKFARIDIADARSNNTDEAVIWNTDPPYYDNIAYADISDYFYLWHRPTLSSTFPELYRRLTTNKADELIAVTYRERKPDRVSDQEWNILDRDERAELFFSEGIGRAFRNIYVRSTSHVPIVIYYAFRQRSNVEQGVLSTGWAAILQALCDSGLLIDGTWPLRTESTAALKAKTNSLASSMALLALTIDSGYSGRV